MQEMLKKVKIRKLHICVTYGQKHLFPILTCYGVGDFPKKVKKCNKPYF